MAYEVRFHEKARNRLLALDNSIRQALFKRMERMKEEAPGRHLKHGADYFIIEVGQYRIAYTCTGRVKMIHFVGKHKDYQQWYSSD